MKDGVRLPNQSHRFYVTGQYMNKWSFDLELEKQSTQMWAQREEFGLKSEIYLG